MRTRIISAVIGAPLLIAAVLWPGSEWPFRGWPMTLLVLAMILVGLREFYDGCRMAGLAPQDGIGYLAGFLFLILSTPLAPDEDRRIQRLGVTALVMLSLAIEALRRRHAPLKNLAPTWMGALYVGWLFSFVVRLRLEPTAEMARTNLNWTLPSGWMAAVGEGGWLLLFTILVTSTVDTGAYFAGKALGKHKLAPEVSPGKTWEGSVGGFLAAILVAGLIGTLWLKLPLPFCLTAGALIGVLSQLGDLSKSAIKREIGIKDFGALIPGHGGVLDRFDSLLFTAPTVYWLLLYWKA